MGGERMLFQERSGRLLTPEELDRLEGD